MNYDLAEDHKNGYLVLVAGDLHVGSTVGLMPEIVTLDSGQLVYASAFQRKLLAAWNELYQFICAKKKKRRLVFVSNGDLIDGDHHNTSELITKNLGTQVRVARDTLSPFLRIADYRYFIRGTEAHVGNSALFEELIAEMGNATKVISSANYTTGVLRLSLNNVGFDIAHHVRKGRREWSNTLQAEAASLELGYWRAGMTPPRYAVRNHVHFFGDSGLNGPVQLLTNGCWQGQTSFGLRISPHRQPEIGALWFEVDGDGVSRWDRRQYDAENI